MAGDKLDRAAVELKTPQQIECEQLERECYFRKYRELLEELIEEREDSPVICGEKGERALQALDGWWKVLREELVEFGMLPRRRQIIREYEAYWWNHFVRNDFSDDEDLRSLEGSVYAMRLQYQQFFDWGIKDTLIISHHWDRLGLPGEEIPGPDCYARKKTPKRSRRHRGFALLRRLRRKVIPKTWRYYSY